MACARNQETARLLFPHSTPFSSTFHHSSELDRLFLSAAELRALHHMSRPRLATLLVFVGAVGMLDPGVAFSACSTRGHHPPLLDCGPAPILSKNDDARFRTNLASALAALPSAAAADRDAFAAVQFGRAGPGSAFARGACFGANVSSSPAAVRACEACLSAAARDVTGGCRASGRAGVWRAGCFLSYGDSAASCSRDDKFRAWFYAGPSTNATLADGDCAADRSAANCARCFDDSARAAKALGWWQRIHGEEVLVVGYSCFLRVQISLLPKGPDDGGTVGNTILVIWLDSMFEAAGVSLVILLFKIIRALPQVNNV